MLNKTKRLQNYLNPNKPKCIKEINTLDTDTFFIAIALLFI